MKTQGEVQSEISNSVAKFMQENMGKGPISIKTNIIEDIAVIRTKGILTETEKHLAKSVPGKELLVSVRRYLINSSGRNYIVDFFSNKLNFQITNFYYDCDPLNDEEVIVCTMSSPVSFRMKKT
jgi:uncharacterized protein YbcI